MSPAFLERGPQVGRKSVEELRDLVVSGVFSSVTAADDQTGEVQDPEARALFATLPVVSPATLPEELIEHELLERLPANVGRVQEQPKYRVGREVFVRTTVDHANATRIRPAGQYDRFKRVAFTHLGVLKAQRGDAFLVSVPGASGTLEFSKADVFAWNEPTGVPAAGGTLSGVHIDYNEPLMKAHICAGYIGVAEELAALDFAAEEGKVRSQQAKILHSLASRVRMSYIGRSKGFSGPKAGPLLHGGQGVCFVQRAVAAAYLQAFARVLGFELQVAVGRTLQLKVPHGFALLTLMPSLARYVCDPAWSQPLTDLRVAFFGPGWGHDRRLVGFEGSQELDVGPDDVELPEEEDET